MGQGRSRGLTLDSGALLALERGRRELALLLRAALDGGGVAIPSGVLAQSWLGGARQARIGALIGDRRVQVPALDRELALGIGRLLAATGSSDVVDGQVALVATAGGDVVVTSDAAEVRRLAPALPVVEV